MIPEFDYEVKNQEVFLKGKNVTNQLQETQIVQVINLVTGLPEIRAVMVEKQHQMAQPGIIMVGRDITSVVLPQADLKIYLDSSPETRAQRRYQQNLKQGINDSFETIKQDIIKRDESDKNREHGALVKVKDA